MLKQTMNEVATPLAHIVNLSLSHRIFPNDMKLAKIVPIFKNGNTKLFNNYRPISILPAFSKILEKLVFNRLLHFLETKNILNVCYNNILRRLLRRPRYCSASGLFAECGIPNCKAVIRSLIYKFITRLNESTNDVILAILSSDIRWTSRIRRY